MVRDDPPRPLRFLDTVRRVIRTLQPSRPDEKGWIMSNLLFKRLLVISAILLASVALMVALSVIPAARTDSASGVIPEGVVSAFWLNFGLGLLSAIGCVLFAISSRKRTRTSTSVLVGLGLVVLLLGWALSDAATAYRSHDGEMQRVSTLLFVCAALNLVAGALAATAAFTRSRKRAA